MKFLLFNTIICLEEIIIVFLNYFWFDDRLCDNSITDILAAFQYAQEFSKEFVQLGQGSFHRDIRRMEHQDCNEL